MYNIYIALDRLYKSCGN